jgi:putative methanogenesis marker 16 metalloprotein
MRRTVEEINDLVARGEAIVMTAGEVERLVAEGREQEVREVDVVTTGTMGLMSGTYAVLSFPITRPGEHRRFVRGSINGVPLLIGPCPNEGLGVIDAMVFGTARSTTRPGYGAGHLFRELAERKAVEVEATSEEGRAVRSTLTLDDMRTALLMSTRNLFRNYRALVNPSDVAIPSIFHSRPFPPRFTGLTFSGCGHLSPLQNDPGLRTIGVGTKLLFNGGEGFVIGAGTRSSSSDPNLMTVADLRSMDPTLTGGFLTAAGPECICSYAVPIPVLDDGLLASIRTRDEDIPLPVADVRDRSLIALADYGQVWSDREAEVRAGPDLCRGCGECAALAACPAGAISRTADGSVIDRERCFNCGTCLTTCAGSCFEADLGRVHIKVHGEMIDVPVVCRQSNRQAALRTAEDLKRRVLDGRFVITGKVADIRP